MEKYDGAGVVKLSKYRIPWFRNNPKCKPSMYLPSAGLLHPGHPRLAGCSFAQW